MADKIFEGLSEFESALDSRPAGKIVHLMRGLPSCGKSHTSKRYAPCAIGHNYTVELREPESELWNEIRVLLKYKKYTMPVLEKWKGEK